MDFNQKQLGQFGELLQRAAVDAVVHAQKVTIQSEPEVKILADSIANGHRLTTFQLKYQRFILPEVNTHRVFSRNSRSSRATPIKKNIELVETKPWGPIEWGLNQKGMVAEKLLTDEQKLKHVQYIWASVANAVAKAAMDLDQNGIHKQIANRLLESFLPIETVLSSTEWDNFFEIGFENQLSIQFLTLLRVFFFHSHINKLGEIVFTHNRIVEMLVCCLGHIYMVYSN